MRADASTEPSAAAAVGGTGRLLAPGGPAQRSWPLMAHGGGGKGCLGCMCMCRLVCLLMGEGLSSGVGAHLDRGRHRPCVRSVR